MVATIKFSQFAAMSLTNTTNKLVGVSALSSGQNFYTDYPLTWATSGRPTSPAAGVLGYNSDLGQYEYWNGATWIQLAAGGSGSVNLGGFNQLAIYNTNPSGTSVAGFSNSPSKVLTTTSGSVPQWSSTLPAALTLPQPVIQGITNGSSPGSGQIGETISNQITQASGTNVNNNAVTVLTSIVLPAGVWKIGGTIGFQDVANNFIYGAGWINDDGTTVNDLSLQTVLQINAANAVNQCFPLFYPVQSTNSTKTFRLMARQTNGSSMAINTFGYIEGVRIA